MSATQLTITARADRMIDRDAIVLCPYVCKGRNKGCECATCLDMLSSEKKKINWKHIIGINGNIKGGKAFIRSELPKHIQGNTRAEGIDKANEYTMKFRRDWAKKCRREYEVSVEREQIRKSRALCEVLEREQASRSVE